MQNFKDSEWETPLHFAAFNGHFEVFKFLFEKVEDKNPMAKWPPRTPLHIAAKRGHFDICKLIIEYIQDNNPSHLGYFRLTTIRLALDNGHLKIADYIRLCIDNKK